MGKKLYVIIIIYLIARVLFAFLIPTSGLSVVQAQTNQVLEWFAVEKPGKTGNLVVDLSEISQIAVSTENVIYSLDKQNGKLYRTQNGGSTWTDITHIFSTNGLPAPCSQSYIAAAPDKPSIVALVTIDAGIHVVLISTDGGDTWINTNLPAINGEIQCITISRAYIVPPGTDLTWSIAIGTAKWGDDDTDGQVWLCSVGSAISGWKNLGITATTDGTITKAEVSAITFSPNYNNDGVILAVGSTANDVTPSNKTSLYIYQRDLSDAVKWNKLPNFPVHIVSAGDDANVERVISALALPSDYFGGNSSSMVSFLSYNRRSTPLGDSSNDVYRVNSGASSIITRLYAGVATGDAFANISSLSFNGTIRTGEAGIASGRLLAGDYGTNAIPPYGSDWPFVQVRRCFNPFDTIVSWQKAKQPPTGPGSAQVAWNSNGTQAYCGTSRIPEYVPPDPDESAFSRSLDNGDTWEQVSLIDTDIRICDIAPAPDSKSLFLATYNELGYEWVWRSAGEPLGQYWGRILGLDTDSNRIILRLSPNYLFDYTIVAAEKDGGNSFAISHDRGNYWRKYNMPAPMIDLIITDENTILAALEDGQMRKTMNDGAIWQYPVITNVNKVNMLSLASNGDIFVGSRDGRVSYSTDDGASFTPISATMGRIEGGDAHVIPDSKYEQNKTIYAATDIDGKGVYRWVIGSSSEWELIDLSMLEMLSGEEFSGLAMGEEGTLYALRKESVNSTGSGGMNRSLNPTEVHILEIEWDVINITLPAGVAFDPEINLYTHTLSFLKLSGNMFQNELWSVDTQDDDHTIYRFIDNICKEGAWIDKLGEIGCDPTSGRNQGFELIWEQLSLSDEYEISMAKDDSFSMTLATVEPASNPFYAPFSVVSPAYLIEAGESLDCGHGYYWRVRTRHAVTGEYIRSPWSDTGDFLVKAGFAVVAPNPGPQFLSPETGCRCSCNAPVSFSWSPIKEAEVYLFQLSENADMSSPIVTTYVWGTTAYQHSTDLKCNTSYFCRVIAVEPAPSEWSAILSFVTGDMAATQKTVTPVTGQTTPLWAWIMIAGGSILIVCLLVLIIQRRAP